MQLIAVLQLTSVTGETTTLRRLALADLPNYLIASSSIAAGQPDPWTLDGKLLLDGGTCDSVPIVVLDADRRARKTIV